MHLCICGHVCVCTCVCIPICCTYMCMCMCVPMLVCGDVCLRRCVCSTDVGWSLCGSGAHQLENFNLSVNFFPRPFLALLWAEYFISLKVGSSHRFTDGGHGSCGGPMTQGSAALVSGSSIITATRTITHQGALLLRSVCGPSYGSPLGVTL